MILGLLLITFSILIISFFIIRNLTLKFEKQQEVLISYLEYLNQISGIIEFSENKLKEIDHKGHFEADDEVGWFFEQIKNIQEILNGFQIKKL